MSSRNLWSKLALLTTVSTALVACGSSDPGVASVPPEAAPDAAPIIDSTPPEPEPSPTPPVPPEPPPFGAEVGEWTWIDVPESTCGNGQPTGFGVNVGTSKELVIFLEGGGACWDEFTCAGIGFAARIKDGFSKTTFDAIYKDNPPKGWILDRDLETNPFKTASYILVPYCTGDVYSGDATQQWLFPPRTMHYAGRKNIEAFLSRIGPAFESTSRVTMSGSSAGGFGAALNYWRVKEAFASKRVDLIDDSGPPFEQGNIPLIGTWKQAWNMDGVLPPACADCKGNIAALTDYYAKTYPSDRFSFLSYDLDNIISLIFLSSQQVFSQNLRSVAENRLNALPNWRYFIVPGSSHTTLYNMKAASGGVELDTWLTQMTSGDPAWKSVAPY